MRWSKQYCKSSGGWMRCRRYKLETQGVAHPDNMLPDGSIDETLA